MAPDGAEWHTYVLLCPVNSRKWIKVLTRSFSCVFCDLTWQLHRIKTPYLLSRRVRELKQPFGFDWEDVVTEAKEISESRNINLDDVFFCTSCLALDCELQIELKSVFSVWKVSCYVFLARPKHASWNEIPTTLYYHWNPYSSKACEKTGFYSAEKAPDGGAWQGRLEAQDWEFRFNL